MAFFGLTFMGHQDPFRDRRLALPKYEVPVGTPTPKLELFYPKLPPIGPAGYEDSIHQGSYSKYQEMIRQKQLKKYPKQEYRVPLTCAQEIGWWLPMDPSVKPEDAIPWMRTQRHPQLRSPMTKLQQGDAEKRVRAALFNKFIYPFAIFGLALGFVDSMAISNPFFSLF